MKRTALGLTAMVASLLLGTIVAAGSLIAMRGKLDSAALTAQPLSAPTLLVACLDPLAILLEIAAIALLLLDSRQVSRLHRRLVWTAAACFALWALANLGGFLPLSLAGMRQGSLALVRTGQLVKATAALLQYAVPFLLVYGLARRGGRVLLRLALASSVVGNLGTILLPIATMQLERVDVPGQTLYVPRFAVDYTTGAHSALLALGYLGGALYLVVYLVLAWRAWREAPAGLGPLQEA